MPGEPFHVLVSGIVREPGFVGMNAQRRVDEIVFLGQSDSAIYMLGSIAVSDRDEGTDPGFPRPRDYLLAVVVELLAIQVCVRINKHRRWVKLVGTGTLARPCRAKLGSFFPYLPYLKSY